TVCGRRRETRICHLSRAGRTSLEALTTLYAPWHFGRRCCFLDRGFYMAKSTSAPAAPDSKGSPPPLASIQDFLFGAPLYTNYDLNAAADLSTPFVSIEIQMFDFSLVVDSHCPDCHAASTFSRTNGPRRTGAMRSPTLTNCSYFELTCARRGDHK